EIFIGSLSSIEICGYGLLIISMLSLLLTYKFGIPLKVFSWGGVAIAATVIVIGTSKRLSSKIGT
ncbi:MAG: hypothetical protein GTO02_11010, partial [Candidatus Dadabacteria bacterium]|nr:hypothetical protein [Candidatus Dadabacteria bacterium]